MKNRYDEVVQKMGTPSKRELDRRAKLARSVRKVDDPDNKGQDDEKPESQSLPGAVKVGRGTGGGRRISP